jgi:diaminopimelate decarboxylase
MEKKPFVTKSQVEEIVKTYPTPFHLYDEKGIRENMKALIVNLQDCEERRDAIKKQMRDSASILQ